MTLPDEGFSLGRGEAMLETKDALLVRLSTGTPTPELVGKERWIPKSVIHDDSEVFERGHTGHVVVEFWWAEKKGWA